MLTRYNACHRPKFLPSVEGFYRWETGAAVQSKLRFSSSGSPGGPARGKRSLPGRQISLRRRSLRAYACELLFLPHLGKAPATALCPTIGASAAKGLPVGAGD